MTAYSNPDRDGCTLGNKRIIYATLSRDYRCNECGGCITLKWNDDEEWYPECAKCGGRDFIHQREREKQEAEAAEVLGGLPADFAAVLGYTKRPQQQEIFSLNPEPVEL